MNVVQINCSCGVGSIGRIATDLHAILLSQGHQSTVAFGRFEAIDCAQVIRIGSVIDNYLHVARTRLFDTHGFGSVIATKAFIQKLKALNPDVVHLYNLHGYYLNVGLLFEYLKETNVAVVWTLMDCWPFTGHCAHFDFVGCHRWKSECHHCPLKSEYPKSLFLDRSQRNYRQKKALFTGVPKLTIVTPSQWLADLVKESFLREYPVALINNAIDLTVFKPRPGDFRERYHLQDQFILLGVAFTWEGKGLPYFTQLAKQLRLDEKVVLVGLTPQQIKQLPPEIIGIPRTNNAAELARIYSAADVFVNPTLEDTFPTTNLEALACGTPVVTFNSGGSPESVDTECGLVVARGDLTGLVAAIGTVRKLGKESYAAKCRQRALERFDKDARLAEYVRLYLKSLDGREGGRAANGDRGRETCSRRLVGEPG